MASQRNYRAEFWIGARLLGSFRGVMAQAQAGLTRLRTGAMAVGRGIMGMVGRFGALTGALAAFGAANVLGRMFADARDRAEQSLQVTRQIEGALLSQSQVAKQGPRYAAQLTEELKAQGAALSEQGIYSRGVYNNMIASLATTKVTPAAIKQTLPILNDVLATFKGTRATTEDAQKLATAWGRALRGGPVRGLAEYGILIDKTNAKEWKALKMPAQRQKYLTDMVRNYAGNMERLAKTDEGKVAVMNRNIADFASTLSRDMLPVQAKMAEFWNEVIPALQPIAKDVFRGIAGAMGDMAGFARTAVVPMLNDVSKWFKGPGAEAFAGLSKAWSEMSAKVGPEFQKAFEGIFGAGKDLKSVISDALVATINALAAALKWVGDKASWLVPTLVSLAAAFGVISAAVAIFNAGMAVLALVMSPLTLVTVGIAALIAGIVLLIQNWEAVSKATLEFWNTLKAMPVIGPMLQDIENAVKGMLPVFQEAWKGLEQVFKSKSIEEAWAKLKEVPVIGPELQAVERGFNDLMTRARESIRVIGETWGKLKEVPVIDPVLKGLEDDFRNTVTNIGPIMQGLWAAMKTENIEQLWAALKDVPVLGPKLQAIQDAFQGVFTGAMDQLTALWNALQNVPVIGPSLQAIGSALTSAMADPIGTIRQAWDGLTGAFTAGATTIGSALTTIDQAIRGAFLAAIEAVKRAWDGLVGAISSFRMPDLIGGAKSAWEGVKSRFGGGQPASSQFGRIASTPMLSTLAERGPEAVIPLRSGPRSEGLLSYAAKAIGGGGTVGAARNLGQAMQKLSTMNFAPNITINGNADMNVIDALQNRLASMAEEFLSQMNAAQDQERRLSFEA
jgi:phage-related protein